MSAELVAAWLRAAAAAVHDRREWLTELDAAIGDGDHGINLDRGFRAIVTQLDRRSLAGATAGSLLSDAGRTIMSTVGGASGALYGRAFERAGARLVELARARIEDGTPARASQLLPAVDAGAAGLAALIAAADAIAALGRSAAGEKTMLDALFPAASAMAACGDASLADRLASAAAAARAGAVGTVPMLARKGRASYLGERSIGHLDPGAASSALLLDSVAAVARSMT